MPLTILTADEPVPLARHDLAVCVPLYGAHDAFVECLRSLLDHTPPDVPILISDDASPDERSRRFLEELDAAGSLPASVHYVRHERNGGFVANVNDAFRRLAPADVVIVNSDCVVTDGWLDAFRRAAASSTLVATVSVLTNHGTILSLPHRNRPQSRVPQTTTGDRAAAAIAASSLRLHPRLPTLVGHCCLVTRAALDLVGDFDLAFSPGYGEEVDFSQRCVAHGLVHVLADDAFVVHQGSVSFSANKARAELQATNDRTIGTRYPYYYEWVAETERDELGPFARSLRTAQRALRGLTVSIDGRCLTPIVTGTQVATLELVVALRRVEDVHVRVVVPPDLGEYARAILAQHDVSLVSIAEAELGVELSDIVHRPYQVSSAADLTLLTRLGQRVVITHLDLISYDIPAYFRSYEAWTAYRRLTQHALALADGVAFISRTSAEEAVAEELLPRERAHVVHLGTDHALDGMPARERPPAGMERIGERPFLLCFGTDFKHKNRVFALRLLRALRERHGWDGALVFAGAHADTGASAADEAAYLTRHRELASFVVDVAAVDEGAKRWLLRNATMMVYPSVHEGFGFVPFEAADAGLAAIFAAQTSLAELLPSSLALIEKWDAEQTAANVAPYLDAPERRAELVGGVRAAAARLTWRRTAEQLADVYRTVATQPTRTARRLAEDLVAMEADRERLEQRIEELGRDLMAYDPIAKGLVGPGGALPADLRRPLLAIAMRPALRTLVFGPVRLAYRIAYRVSHLGRRPPER